MKHHYVEFTAFNEETKGQNFLGKVRYTEERGVVIDEALNGFFTKDGKGNVRIPIGNGVSSTPKDGLKFLKNVSLLFSSLSRVSVTEVKEFNSKP